MYFNKYRKSKKGFILVYTLLITSICFITSLGCFKMELLKRDNNINFKKEINKLDLVQRDREYLLTDLDSYIYANLQDINCENIKNLFLNQSEKHFYFESSYIKYLNNMNSFYLCFYFNGSFYREELYKYNVSDGNVFYIPTEYSYKQGVLENWIEY